MKVYLQYKNLIQSVDFQKIDIGEVIGEYFERKCEESGMDPSLPSLVDWGYAFRLEWKNIEYDFVLYLENEKEKILKLELKEVDLWNSDKGMANFLFTKLRMGKSESLVKKSLEKKLLSFVNINEQLEIIVKPY